MLVEMGYDIALSKKALKKSKSDIDLALDFIHSQENMGIVALRDDLNEESDNAII